MNITIKISLVCSLVWIGFKLVAYLFLWNVPSYAPVFVMSNMFVLLVAVSLGLYLQKQRSQEESTFSVDLKNGMTSGLVYALVVSVFLYFYYEKIDPDYNAKMIADRELYVQSVLDTPNLLAELKASNQDLEVMTKEEIMEKYRETPQILFSGIFMMTYGLLALITLSVLYSVVVALIYNKILFR